MRIYLVLLRRSDCWNVLIRLPTRSGCSSLLNQFAFCWELLIRPRNRVEVSHLCAGKNAQGWGTEHQYLRAGSRTCTAPLEPSFYGMEAWGEGWPSVSGAYHLDANCSLADEVYRPGIGESRLNILNENLLAYLPQRGSGMDGGAAVRLCAGAGSCRGREPRYVAAGCAGCSGGYGGRRGRQRQRRGI
jgi:hypothetical protein